VEVKAVTGDINEISADVVIINLFEGVSRPGGATGVVDQAMDGLITQLIADGEIKGKLYETTLIHTMGKIAGKRILVVGLGKQEKLSLDLLRSIAAVAARASRKAGAKRVATIIHGTGAGGFEVEKASQAITEGTILGLYRFRKHMAKDDEDRDINEFVIIQRDKDTIEQVQRGVSVGKIMAEATSLARDMVNEPANKMTPTDMASIAKAIADEYGLDIEVVEREEMERLGMGGLLGVAQGSTQLPKFIILKYHGNSSKPAIALVGKGLTFDSGGISIKPSERMHEMKGDMSGGAAVITAMKAIAQLKPAINVTGIVPAVENLPDGAAYKPGDVLVAMNGKTIEVLNTDAEGRLALADALSYAVKENLSPIIDIATLTGACHIALGDFCSGIFGYDQNIIDAVIKAGEEVGERHWQLPMYEEYKEQNKSDIADIKNTGGRYGGAITAAQFLGEFSGDTPWAHLDIAGTFMMDKERGYLVKGATGVGVRTLVNFVLTMAADKHGD